MTPEEIEILRKLQKLKALMFEMKLTEGRELNCNASDIAAISKFISDFTIGRAGFWDRPRFFHDCNKLYKKLIKKQRANGN